MAGIDDSFQLLFNAFKTVGTGPIGPDGTPGVAGPTGPTGPAGGLVQVVAATYNSGTSSNSSAYADTGLTATITPTNASHRILVLVQQAGCGKNTGNTDLSLTLVRGVTTLATFEGKGGNTASTADNFFGTCGCVYVDSPASTSALVYKTRMASSANIPAVYTNWNGSLSSIVLCEIAV
jgi:hypothetical protein